MTKIVFTLILFFAAYRTIFAQNHPVIPPNGISFEIDLRRISNDKLSVICRPGGSEVFRSQQRDSILFFFPKIVPGIYGAMDFGQYIVDFAALDAAGRALPVQRLNMNTWMIRDAQSLDRLQYAVNDTWDDFAKASATEFYKSAGSMFKKNSVFLLNNNCLFGYFEGFKQVPQYLTIFKPAAFYGATALLRPQTPLANDTTDYFFARNYPDLVDGPLLYAKPDTVHIRVGNADVLIAVYAEEQGKYAGKIAAGIRVLLENQKDYLGGALPVDRYAFLIYHMPSADAFNRLGDALEHAHSSLYLFMLEGLESVSGMVHDIAAHEFFHIVTPLNIHSEEIENYDFNAPVMSRHLWLYEGMTEYATIHMPVKQGLITVKQFLRSVEEKLSISWKYRDDLSLTALSLHAMDLQDQYFNVYLKGALVGLCLDATLRDGSDGRFGTQDLMHLLSARYGPDKPFRDDALFDEIAAITRPEIRDFFRRYVEGTEPLPLKAVFQKAGIRYKNGHLKIKSNATPEELAFRKTWLGQ